MRAVMPEQFGTSGRMRGLRQTLTQLVRRLDCEVDALGVGAESPLAGLGLIGRPSNNCRPDGNEDILDAAGPACYRGRVPVSRHRRILMDLALRAS